LPSSYQVVRVTFATQNRSSSVKSLKTNFLIAHSQANIRGAQYSDLIKDLAFPLPTLY